MSRTLLTRARVRRLGECVAWRRSRPALRAQRGYSPFALLPGPNLTRSPPPPHRANTRADIDRLAVQLQEERLLRQQKEQYAVLARRINAYPAREQTQAPPPPALRPPVKRACAPSL